MPEHNIVTHYSTKRCWRSITMVKEKKEAESVIYERRKKRVMISDCYLKD